MTPHPARRHVTRLVAALAAGTLGATGLLGAAAEAAPWAPAEEASIHPGVQTVTRGAQCTANFVFTDAEGGVYLGQAAHCASTSGATATDGCSTDSHPLGTEVSIQGASQPGTLVYSSWLTMQARGERDSQACAFNDFALVELASADHGRVNPSLPVWGGPTGLGDTTATGEQVYSYGNSSLRLGIEALSPKTGTSLGTAEDGWHHPVYTVTPGIPGDSGSGFLDADGAAVGVLATLQVAPLAGSNGVSDLGSALDYLHTHTSLDVELAPGTEPFSPLP